MSCACEETRIPVSRSLLKLIDNTLVLRSTIGSQAQTIDNQQSMIDSSAKLLNQYQIKISKLEDQRKRNLASQKVMRKQLQRSQNHDMVQEHTRLCDATSNLPVIWESRKSHGTNIQTLITDQQTLVNDQKTREGQFSVTIRRIKQTRY